MYLYILVYSVLHFRSFATSMRLIPSCGSLGVASLAWAVWQSRRLHIRRKLPVMNGPSVQERLVSVARVIQVVPDWKWSVSVIYVSMYQYITSPVLQRPTEMWSTHDARRVLVWWLNSTMYLVYTMLMYGTTIYLHILVQNSIYSHIPLVRILRISGLILRILRVCAVLYQYMQVYSCTIL